MREREGTKGESKGEWETEKSASQNRRSATSALAGPCRNSVLPSVSSVDAGLDAVLIDNLRSLRTDYALLASQSTILSLCDREVIKAE